MPKIAVAIISGAIVGIIGFLLGSLFTLPQNQDMEKLVEAKNVLAKQIKEMEAQQINLQKQKDELAQTKSQLQAQILDLKDKLIQAYNINSKPEEEDKKTSDDEKKARIKPDSKMGGL